MKLDTENGGVLNQSGLRGDRLLEDELGALLLVRFKPLRLRRIDKRALRSIVGVLYALREASQPAPARGSDGRASNLPRC